MAFVFVFMIVVVFITLVAAAVIVALARRNRQSRLDAQAPRLRADATVVDKRSEITGGGETRAVQHYFVTFQFPDGNRLELEVAGSESGMLTPGDTGSLDWQGSRYLGFAREILR
jgi:hypothetical protein